MPANDARRIRALQTLGVALSSASTREAVAAAIAQHAVDALEDGAGCVVAVVDGDELELIGARGLAPAGRRRFPLTAALPIGDAILARRAVWLPRRADYDARYTPTGVVRDHEFFALAAVPLIAGDHCLGAIGFSFSTERAFDERERDFIEAFARQCAQALDRARLLEELTAAVRLRDQFLSIASHELKTPVAALLLQLESMRRTLAASGSPAAAGPWPDRITKQVERLSRLVDELLDVTRLQEGRARLETEPCDLGELVSDLVERVRDQSPAPIRVVASAPCVGAWDRGRLEQVLLNLLTNAAKYGGGTPIEVRVIAEASRARLEVHDAGPGVPPGETTRIFEPFSRGSNAHHQPGLGLGLFIVKRLVEAHQGAVRVERAAAGGAAFIVELPLGQ